MQWLRVAAFSGFVGSAVCSVCTKTIQPDTTDTSASTPEKLCANCRNKPCCQCSEPCNPCQPRQQHTCFGDALIRKRNLELKQVHVFFRHGARTPLHLIAGIEEAIYPKDLLQREAWHTTFALYPVMSDGKSISTEPSMMEQTYRKLMLKGDCLSGQLTSYGKDQMYQLGMRLRRDYIINYPLLEDTFNPEEVIIRSSNMNRTIQSGRCVLAGLFGNGLLKTVGSIPMPVGYSAEEFLYPNVAVCAVLRNLTSLVMANQDDFPGLQEDCVKVARALGMRPDQKLDFMAARDDLVGRLTHGLPIPPGVLPYLTVIEKHATMLLYCAVNGCHQAERPLATKLSVGRALNLAVKVMSGQKLPVPGPCPGDLSSRRLHLYSTHDALLVGLLEALGIFDWKWPPFAADLRLEVWEDNCQGKFVRVLYCGKEQVIRDSRAGLVSFDEFRRCVGPYLTDDAEFAQLCESRVMAAIEKDYPRRYQHSGSFHKGEGTSPAGM